MAPKVDRARELAAARELDALLITPSADLRYLTGYNAHPLERLTCLVIPAAGEPFLVVPLLEKPAALAVGGLDIEVVAHRETDDAYALIASRLPGGIKRVGLDNHMWAEKVLAFRRAMPNAEQQLAGDVLRELRMRKTPAEVESLRARRGRDRPRARADGAMAAGRAHGTRGRPRHQGGDRGRRP